MDESHTDAVTTSEEGTSAKTDLQQGNDQNPPLQNVAAAYAGLPTKGHVRKFFVAESDNLIGHVQGMAVYKRRWIITTHDTVHGAGYFFVYDLHTDHYRTFLIPTPEGYRHPTSVQILGDYLVVGVEPSESVSNPSWTYFYDLTDIGGRGPIRLSSPQIRQPARGAASLALAKGPGVYYTLAVFWNRVVYFYLSNGRRLGDPSLGFDPNPWWWFNPAVDGKSVGYDNMGLVIDQRQNPYLIGLRGDEHGDVIADYGDLWELNPNAKAAQLVRSTHFYTETEGTGQVGPHFRFGASVTVLNPTDLQICCSPRSLVPVLPLHYDLIFNVFGNNGNW